MAKKRDRADSGSSQRPAAKRQQRDDEPSSSDDASDPDQYAHTYNLRNSQKKDDRRPGKKAGLEKKTKQDIQAAAASKRAMKKSKGMKKEAQQQKYLAEVAEVAELLRRREAQNDAEDVLMDQEYRLSSDEDAFKPDTSAYERSKKTRPPTIDDEEWVEDKGDDEDDEESDEEGDDKDYEESDEEEADEGDDEKADDGRTETEQGEHPNPKITPTEKKYLIVNALRRTVLGEDVDPIEPPQVHVFPIGPPWHQ
ncbi:hypothetical protein NLI96_g12178 [Meripilus lineatus]|uniref:Uncharacterized protein n=1 Tax=Meripilus lineatus TaxID=2056292 RepID=A0AAD5UQH3_9APHY|nr:hypothetical protein NLI96_g12178 [Physisporinus lineatus]